jgi:hypothetical protein
MATATGKEISERLRYYVGKTVSDVVISDDKDGRHFRIMFQDGTYIGIPDLPDSDTAPALDLGILTTAIRLRVKTVEVRKYDARD